MEYEFDKPPPVGTAHERYGNRYELIETTPYTRKSDNAQTWLLTWLGSCATCGVPFRVNAGLTTNSLNRRCSECADPLRPATKAAKKARRAGGKKAGARMKAQAKARKELMS